MKQLTIGTSCFVDCHEAILESGRSFAASRNRPAKDGVPSVRKQYAHVREEADEHTGDEGFVCESRVMHRLAFVARTDNRQQTKRLLLQCELSHSHQYAFIATLMSRFGSSLQGHPLEKRFYGSDRKDGGECWHSGKNTPVVAAKSCTSDLFF